VLRAAYGTYAKYLAIPSSPEHAARSTQHAAS
jgi:hypothetical protein